MTGRPRVLLLVAVAVALLVGLLGDLLVLGVDDPAAWVPDVAVGWAFLLAAGAVALRATGSRPALLLALVGVTWFVGTLVPPLALLHRGPLVHLALAWPSGRLPRPVAVVVALGYVAAAVPRAWGSETGTIALAVGLVLAAVLHRRAARGPLGRARQQALRVTVGVAGVLVVSAAARVGLPRGEADAATLLAYQGALVAVAVLAGRAAGTGSGREVPVTDLVLQLGGRSGAVAEALARLLDDPSLRVGYRAGDGFVDASGRLVELPGPGDGRAVTPVLHAGEQVAVLVHDAAVLTDRALLEAVAVAARLSEEHARLQRQVELRLRDLTDSRRRLLLAADTERARLAQRVADGADRRLAELADSLRRLRSATDDVTADDVAAAQDALDRTRDDLRLLAGGLDPSSPVSGGLRAALQDLADRSPLPVTVSGCETAPRPEVRTAVWFVCAEALANAARHAHASSACVELSVDDAWLQVTVTDDGTGGADPAAGTGLRGLQDRVETVGGRLAVGPAAGGGTEVRAALPLQSSTGTEACRRVPDSGSIRP